MLNIQLCFTGNNYILKDIKTENIYFKLQYFTILFCEIIFSIFYKIVNALTEIHFNGTNFINARLTYFLFDLWPNL